MGAVYLFARSGTTWASAGKLLASTPDPDDSFGWAVSVEGATLLIGAGSYDRGGGECGAGYGFQHDGTNWHERDILAGSTSLAT